VISEQFSQRAAFHGVPGSLARIALVTMKTIHLRFSSRKGATEKEQHTDDRGNGNSTDRPKERLFVHRDFACEN